MVVGITLVWMLLLGQSHAGTGLDSDLDGYCDGQVGDDCDNALHIAGDCDDSDPTVFPGALELCDGQDNDCNLQVDEIPEDIDGDGYSAIGACSGSQDDCNDYLESVFPGALEVCNGTDDNCDGVIDGGSLMIDDDGDGFASELSCHIVTKNIDCDDTDPTVFPGAVENLTDQIDNDCDSFVDIAPENVDNDQDGYCEGISISLCRSQVAVKGVADCDDDDSSRSWAVLEWLDGLDNDCDGIVDNLDGLGDQDKDGYCGNQTSCSNAQLLPGDCNDSDSTVNPGQVELCNGRDDNCDGLIWDDLDERDADGDGFLVCQDCEPGVHCGDCDDTDPLVFPGQYEDCTDGIDNDCDGNLDQIVDEDQDGHFTCLDDCNDASELVYLGAVEVCDGLDNNCNRVVDEGFDADMDGVSVCAGDCDDLDAFVKPGLREICDDGIDNNCDGIAENQATDGDADSDLVTRCEGDCNDTIENGKWVSPFHPEICDGIDNDCDGLIDETYDKDGDGSYTCFGDCNDSPEDNGELAYAGLNEADPEDCDLLDNDCNGVVDDLWPDLDEDGFSECEGDCDQEAGWGSPISQEICDDTFDNDCDGDADSMDLDCLDDLVDTAIDPFQVVAEGRIQRAWFCGNVGQPMGQLTPLLLVFLIFGVRRKPFVR